MHKGLVERFAIIVMKPAWKLMRSLPCLMVLTGNGYALKLENGVLVLPINCLKD